MHRAFWAAGHIVFPIYSFDKNLKCACGNPDCAASGKHPQMPNWQNVPLFDDEAITNMEEAGWFKSGYGVRCDTLLVLDVDARNGGVESLSRLIYEFPSINEARLEVETGSGGGSRHIYFSMPEKTSLVQNHADYPGIDFKSSGFVVGPGSRHVSGGEYQADGYPEEITEAPADLVEFLRRPERHRTVYNGNTLDLANEDIADMLTHIDPEGMPYEDWSRIGMAIHHATHGNSYYLWEEWSQKSTKYDPDKMEYWWNHFGKHGDPATMGTLVHYAQKNGWVMSVTFVADQDLVFEEPMNSDGLPVNISGVDLTIPPGFVGEVAAWIESQSRRPRRHLAVASALGTIGNIASLRYTDERDGVTPNMFTFGVAASRTGKESIYQACIAIHKVAGVGSASHGNIKSEQEVLRNLTRHQACFYVLDEVGILLQKIANSQKRGGASYFEGVIGIFMSVYSKANGSLMITGDASEELKEKMLKELSQIEKRIEANEGTRALEARRENIKYSLSSLENGLENPILSMMGFTTPVTFDTLVDYQSATNGFFGRALIFNERETVPLTKDNFKAPPMPDNMQMAIQQIFNAGEYSIDDFTRVEYRGEKIQVPTDDDASAVLDALVKWFEDTAKKERAKTGLEALYLGAYELVSKVSLILSVAERVRTLEHVRWAFALVKRDIEEKIRLVVGNDREDDAPLVALHAKVSNLIAGEEGETFGVVCGKLRRKKKEDIQLVLDKMVEEGQARVETTKHPKNGAEIVRYHLTRG